MSQRVAPRQGLHDRISVWEDRAAGPARDARLPHAVTQALLALPLTRALLRQVTAVRTSPPLIQAAHSAWECGWYRSRS
jgi:hypothetical protein